MYIYIWIEITWIHKNTVFSDIFSFCDGLSNCHVIQSASLFKISDVEHLQLKSKLEVILKKLMWRYDQPKTDCIWWSVTHVSIFSFLEWRKRDMERTVRAGVSEQSGRGYSKSYEEQRVSSAWGYLLHWSNTSSCRQSTACFVCNQISRHCRRWGGFEGKSKQCSVFHEKYVNCKKCYNWKGSSMLWQELRLTVVCVQLHCPWVYYLRKGNVGPNSYLFDGEGRGSRGQEVCIRCGHLSSYIEKMNSCAGPLLVPRKWTNLNWIQSFV